VIGLAEIISELRQELETATTAAKDASLRFELGPVELEATVVVGREGSGGGKVRFWVLELGGDAKASQSSTQRIKLTLQPRLAGSSEPPFVSGEAGRRER
jgi:Trypsin-co-occurring domain 2